MNKVEDYEINGMLRMLKSPLREAWEKKHLEGKTLVEIDNLLKQIRKDSKGSIYNPKIRFAFFMSGMLALVVYGYVSGTINDFSTKLTGFLLVFTYIGIDLIFIQQKKAAKKMFNQYEDTFAKLQNHLAALNPHRISGAYWEPINSEYVEGNLVSMAGRILRFKSYYEEKRLQPEFYDRKVLDECSYQIKLSEVHFDAAWETLKEFDLSFNKTEIFKLAKEQLAKQKAS